MVLDTSHERFMKEALKEAQKAFDADEVPVGAVVVSNNMIIARAYNLCERLNDATAHAEMQAITSAAAHLGGKYLNECIIYVTVEPCAMCAGALFWAQAGTIVYGAGDEKRGFRKTNVAMLHPKTKLIGNILETECRELMVEFFKRKR